MLALQNVPVYPFGVRPCLPYNGPLGDQEDLKMSNISLSAAATARLEKLAADAGSTPQKMLKHVLRDGFEYSERVVQSVRAGLADVAAGRVIPHDQVIAKLSATIEKHARKKKAA